MCSADYAENSLERRRGFGDFETFYNWYIEQAQECHYCHITVDTICYLYDNNIIHERLNRGRSLEIDKLDPTGEYCPENCVLACYFCNNDKSQIFTAEQYQLFANPTARREYLEALVRNHMESRRFSNKKKRPLHISHVICIPTMKRTT